MYNKQGVSKATTYIYFFLSEANRYFCVCVRESLYYCNKPRSPGPYNHEGMTRAMVKNSLLRGNPPPRVALSHYWC